MLLVDIHYFDYNETECLARSKIDSDIKYDGSKVNLHPHSSLTAVSTMVLWESSQWLGLNILRSTRLKNSRKVWIGALSVAI